MARLKKDGTPDMRFSENRQAYLPPGRTVSGGFDMRYSSNKSSFASPSPSPPPRIVTTPTYIPPTISSYSSDMRRKVNRELPPRHPVTGGPTKKDGTLDMRYKQNKVAMRVNKPKTTPDYRQTTQKPSSSDMRLKENRDRLPKDPFTGVRLNVDGSRDMRCSENRKLLEKLNVDGTLDRRYKENKEPRRVSQPKTTPDYRKITQKPSSSDMRLKENRDRLPKDPFTGVRLNVDGSRDMRCSENRKLLKKQNVDGTPDRRYNENKTRQSTHSRPPWEYGDSGQDLLAPQPYEVYPWRDSLPTWTQSVPPPDQFHAAPEYTGPTRDQTRQWDRFYDMFDTQPTSHWDDRSLDYSYGDRRPETAEATKSQFSSETLPGPYNYEADLVEPSEAQEKTQSIKKDGKAEYIHVWYTRQNRKEKILLKGRANCLKYDKEHLNADVEEATYEPLNYGWKVNQIQVGEQLLLIYFEEDDNVAFHEQKSVLNNGGEIVFGPDEVCGRDEDTGEYIIGCVTVHHRKGVDYAWFWNDEEFLHDKDLSVIRVVEDGRYHCVVKYRGRREKSLSIDITSINGDRHSSYEDREPTVEDRKLEITKFHPSHETLPRDYDHDYGEDWVESSEDEEKTQLIKKDGKTEYIDVWYTRQNGKEKILLKGRDNCLKYDKEHLNAYVEEATYEALNYGWQVNQIQVGEQVLMYSEDDTVTFPELKRTLNKGEEIIHGPDEVSGRDKENGEFAIGCVTLNHGKGVDYTWFLNDEEFTSGKDLSVIHVEEEGCYHCVVKYKGRREKSSSVEVVSIIKVSADIKMNKEDMTFDEEIGAGSFGTVWKGKWKGTLVSIKEVPLKLSEVPQEVEIARKLRHPNIVALLGVFITKVRFYMVNQYIYGDNLNELLHHADEKPKLKLKANGYVAYQVALGLQYLHTNKIVHQDLKPANILVEAKSRKTYICDFGLAKQRETLASASSTRDSNFKGTLAYCAKESLEGSSMKSKPCVDVYSYGCVLYEIYTRKMVWEGQGLTEVMTKILTGRYPSLNDIHDDTVKDVLSMIFVKAEQRPTMDDILPDIKCLVHNRYAEYI
ncbi:uncharacterized protein [Ptychodera flava]|uniref:uncharacterized protein isoform X2 n=1 Tax=Ptychodera flava TaxID=63121 RepID=UPI00396A2074